MNITWFGYSCFKIEFGARGDVKNALVTDPFTKESRNGLPRTLTADVVTVSSNDELHNNIEDVGGNPYVISGPGEYEVKEVMVTGVEIPHLGSDGKKIGSGIIYYLTVEGLHLAHLGSLKHKLTEAQLEDVGSIDVLFVPVGGGDALEAKEAVEVIKQFEPRVVIPMHYRAERFGDKLAGVEPFLKAMGVAAPETVNKLKLTDRDLPAEETKIYLLEQQ